MSSQRYSRQSRLREFEFSGLPSPPTVILDINCDTVYAPTNDGKIAGRIGVAKHRDGKAFLTYKERDVHYYRKGDGYAISKGILTYLTRNTVYHIIMYESERNRTLEFGIGQYVEDGRRVQHAPSGDPQVYVPENEARHIWHDHNPEMDVRGGSS